MTSFENMLHDKGYIPFSLDGRTMKFVAPKGISTMVNIDNRYFHKSDLNVLAKIESGMSVMHKDFTWEDRKGEICFGLHEVDKPATLVSPRPRINIKRFIEGELEVLNEDRDDAMNIAFQNFTNEEIFEAMYNRDIVLQLNL